VFSRNYINFVMLKNNMPSFFNPKMGGGGVSNFHDVFFCDGNLPLNS